jgi:hypothetical protein
MDSSLFENSWEVILSREPDQIRRLFSSLSAADQAVVLAHLTKMITESGWHPEQVISANAALKALDKDR